MGTIEIYTDGGCHGNPGPGGWAYVINGNEISRKDSGNAPDTTNNKMELTAVIKALEFADASLDYRNNTIVVHTDSQYVKNGINVWIKNWMKNGWKTAAKKPVKNQEFWIELHALNEKIKPDWVWVKGHAGNQFNEECDTMVQSAIAEIE